jgi:hypothetical protein
MASYKADGGEARPDDRIDARLSGWRRKDVIPNEVWCDACAAYYDYHYVLYRSRGSGSILECPRCYAEEQFANMSKVDGQRRAQQIFRSRMKNNRREWKEKFNSLLGKNKYM